MMPNFNISSQICAAILLPASGFLLYWLYQRSSKSDEDIYGSKRVTTARTSVIEVNVPQRAVGAVIGRQGSRIKEIQKLSGARVTFKDKGEEGSGDSKNRVAIIHGSVDSAQQAELMIQQVIAEVPEPITEQIEVPGYSLGRIIGKGGGSIREINNISGARVNIERNTDCGGPETLRTITLIGTQAQIQLAVELIEEKLEQEEQFRNKIKISGDNREKRSQPEPDSREPVKVKPVIVDKSPWDDNGPCAASQRQEKLPLTDGFLQVYLSAVEHPAHFWVQVVGTKALHLERLQNELTSWVRTEDAQMNYKVTDVVPGSLVAAKFEPDDPIYYRAKILREIDGNLDLYFVDYGDNGFVNISSVFKLRSDFESFPFQAVECTLADVTPLGGEGAEWDEACIEAFEQLGHSAQWKVLNAKVVSRHGQKSAYPLMELFDSNGPETINIGETLIKQGLAETTLDVKSQSQLTKSTEGNHRF